MIGPVGVLTSAQDDHLGSRIQLQDLLRKLQAAHAEHGHIGDHEIEVLWLFGVGFQRRGRVICGNNRMAVCRERTCKQKAYLLVVIEIEDSH